LLIKGVQPTIFFISLQTHRTHATIIQIVMYYIIRLLFKVVFIW